jgi:glycine dehydrogenase
LIPASAHGTNPASAAMAGMKIIVTKTMENGNDVEDVKKKLSNIKTNSCLMVTYPSTHGVLKVPLEKLLKSFTTMRFSYMDGANMNAQGINNPATIGADVCHLNLHKICYSSRWWTRCWTNLCERKLVPYQVIH